MNLTLISAAITGALGFGLAWQLQSVTIAELENAHAQQLLVNERASATASIRRSEAVITAQGAAASRAAGLRRDADASRSALVGLRGATETAIATARANHDACVDRATTLSKLLNTVAEAGGELAAKADRHASDVQTLTAAWPK